MEWRRADNRRQLVFQGKLNGDFVAYNAETGEKLWSQNVKSGAASGPGTYSIDGEQYVTITTGWGSAFALVAGYAYDEGVPSTVGKVVTFKVGGDRKNRESRCVWRRGNDCSGRGCLLTQLHGLPWRAGGKFRRFA